MKIKMTLLMLSALLVTSCDAKPPNKSDVNFAFQMRLWKMGVRGEFGGRVEIAEDRIRNMSCYEIDDGPIWKCDFDFFTKGGTYSRSKTNSISIKLRQREDGHWIEQ